MTTLVASNDGLYATATGLPSGTAILHQASCTEGSGGTCVYQDHPVGPVKPYDGMHLHVAVRPRSAVGNDLGPWSNRIKLAIVPAPTESAGWRELACYEHETVLK